MGNLDLVMEVPLHIINPSSATTLVQVDVAHLGRRVEVEVPNNIQEGHRIRLKGLGCVAETSGDLIIEISKITIGTKCVNQKMLLVMNHDFSSVNYNLETGWKVVDFKPLKDRDELYPYVYVLLEKI